MVHLGWLHHIRQKRKSAINFTVVKRSVAKVTWGEPWWLLVCEFSEAGIIFPQTPFLGWHDTREMCTRPGRQNWNSGRLYAWRSVPSRHSCSSSWERWSAGTSREHGAAVRPHSSPTAAAAPASAAGNPRPGARATLGWRASAYPAGHHLSAWKAVGGRDAFPVVLTGSTESCSRPL